MLRGRKINYAFSSITRIHWTRPHNYHFEASPRYWL